MLDYSLIEKLKKSHKAIGHITNPSEELQLIAIRENGYAINYIKNPTERVLKEVYGSTLATEEEQLEAIQKFGYYSTIMHIKNPSEKVQLAAVSRKGTDIKYIENPSEKVVVEAIVNDWMVLLDKYKFSESILVGAVKRKPSLIEHINDPSEKVQMAAVQKHVSALHKINTPTEKVQEYALWKTPKATAYLMFFMPAHKMEDIIKAEIAKPDVRLKYVQELLTCNSISGDKLEFINTFGSNKARAIAMELELNIAV